MERNKIRKNSQIFDDFKNSQKFVKLIAYDLGQKFKIKTMTSLIEVKSAVDNKRELLHYYVTSLV